MSAIEWEQILGPEDTVLHVHIPEGFVLSDGACRDAFRNAETYYRNHFPEISWQAFYCTTWMLDPALDHLFHPGSRIRALARQFHRATTRRPNGRQIIERVLGNLPLDSNFTPKTSLQRAAKEYLDAGGIFWTSGGYRLPVASLQKP